MRTLVLLNGREGVRIGIALSPGEAVHAAIQQDPVGIDMILIQDSVYGIMLSIPPGGLVFLPDESASTGTPTDNVSTQEE